MIFSKSVYTTSNGYCPKRHRGGKEYEFRAVDHGDSERERITSFSHFLMRRSA